MMALYYVCQNDLIILYTFTYLSVLNCLRDILWLTTDQTDTGNSNHTHVKLELYSKNNEIIIYY